MRLAIAATPNIAIPTMEWLFASDHSLDLVITRPDQPVGRGKTLQESDVAVWARDRGLRIVKPVRAHELKDVLSSIDLVVTLAYGLLLPADILAIPKHGFINVHFSLLPAWRGAAPVQRAIQNGDAISGITIFQLDPGMDTGPTYVLDAVDLEPNESAGELLTRLSLRAPQNVERALAKIESGETPIPQPNHGASHAKKIAKSESRIDWFLPAHEIGLQIRAFNPEPGSWTLWRGERLLIHRAIFVKNQENLESGEVSVINDSLLVGCGQLTCLEIEELQPAGKRVMSAREWINGARWQVGERFE